MGIQEDLRAQLIKQLPSEVVENIDSVGETYFACPSCRRPVAMRHSKCPGCNQTLSWENVINASRREGQKRGIIEVDLPKDFTQGNCRKCPLSYIVRNGADNVYECPLGMRGACKLQLI